MSLGVRKDNPGAARVLPAVLLLTAILLACLPFYAFAGDGFAEEVRIGKEEADRFAAEKNTKFIDDPAMVERVQTIGVAIARVAREKEVPATYGKSDVAKFDYTFKIVDDGDINAFSLPGGFIYVNKGLMDYTQSDDELAGVIAHEIAHVSHHHAMQLIATQQKQLATLAGTMIAAAVIGAKGDDLGNLVYMGNLISMAKMSSYGQKAEFDADRTAVAYMVETGYDPVGMLTFMERLARDEMRKPEISYGIFATHPPSHVRAKEIVDEINKRGLSINRRRVTTYMQVFVKPVEGSPAASIWIADTEVVRLTDSGGTSATARAEYVASELRTALLEGAQIRDVRIEGQRVSVFGKPVIEPTPEDAALAGTGIPQLASNAAKQIKLALMIERYNFL